MNEPIGQPVSRRQLLVQASQGGLALGAATALGLSPAAAQDARPAANHPAAATAPVTDFDRSCLRFRIDTTKKPPKTVSQKLPMTLNNVRMTLDARAVITHKPSGRVYDYVLSSSCKSEQVWVDRDIWHQPNADMCMIAGRGEFLVFKRWDKTDKGVMLFPASLGVQPERQLDNPDECFDRFSIDLATRPGRVLENIDAILETLFAGTPVIAQTEYEAGDYRVLLEYPIKVVNFSERERTIRSIPARSCCRTWSTRRPRRSLAAAWRMWPTTVRNGPSSSSACRHPCRKRSRSTITRKASASTGRATA